MGGEGGGVGGELLLSFVIWKSWQLHCKANNYPRNLKYGFWRNILYMTSMKLIHYVVYIIHCLNNGPYQLNDVNMIDTMKNKFAMMKVNTHKSFFIVCSTPTWTFSWYNQSFYSLHQLRTTLTGTSIYYYVKSTDYVKLHTLSPLSPLTLSVVTRAEADAGLSGFLTFSSALQIQTKLMLYRNGICCCVCTLLCCAVLYKSY